MAMPRSVKILLQTLTSCELSHIIVTLGTSYLSPRCTIAETFNDELYVTNWLSAISQKKIDPVYNYSVLVYK